MSDKPSKLDPLRAGAEARIACERQVGTPARPTPEALIHELRVHQIELEMQNEELRRAQAVIEESRDRYVDLYDFAPVGYLTLDRNGMIDEINLTCAALLGADRKKLIEHRFAQFVGEDRDCWQQCFIGALQNEGHRVCEMSLRRGDGSFFQARLDCLRQAGANGIPQVRISLTDITEMKKLEKESQERRKEMEELQRLHIAAQTASAIAHELNQPLLAIASYCKAALLMLEAEEPDFAEIRNALERSERQTHRAGQSIREMFDFLSAKEFSVDDFNLNREIVIVLEDARKEHELQFHSELHLEETLPPVRANRTHVQKALFNLLHNGIEAMHESGVPLPAISVTVRTAREENVAQVTIRDNGPGFRKEDARRLFDPFFTTKANGFGMGLAISRSLIELNGGQIWADPQEGPGAVFHLTIPLAI